MAEPTADLLVRDAKLVATCDADGRELAGGWVAITGGLVSGVGASADPAPAAAETIDASGCLVTPGLVNTHHHIYQNLTRSYGPAINGSLFSWLTALYPLWAGPGRGGGVPVGLGRAGRAGARRLHHQHRPPVRGAARAAAISGPPRSRPRASSASGSTRPGAR